MLTTYGVLKGTPAGHLRDADDDHYQILIQAGTTMHRIAVNVKSSAKNAPSTLLFQDTKSIPNDLKTGLRALAAGYKKLPSKAGGLAQDYVRGGLVKTATMTPVPPDAPGVDNDLKDKLETAVVDAINSQGSVIYAFGAKWGPEPKKKDDYFKFLPGNGIHDIHMNQGNGGQYKKDNGVFQDGAVFIEYPNDDWHAFFFAFQSQTFDTDDQGNRKDDPPPPPPKKKKKTTKKKAKKPAKKKAKKKGK